jgi:hypothetical protein
LRPGMTVLPAFGWHVEWSNLCLLLWRFQESQRPLPCAMMIMSMDRTEKTPQQPRQASLLRPRPIGRDRVVLSHARVCRRFACRGRGTHEFAKLWLGRPVERVREICSSGSVMVSWCGNRRLQSANRTVEDFLISASQVRAQGAPTGRASPRQQRLRRQGCPDARPVQHRWKDRPHRLRTRCRDRRGSDRGLKSRTRTAA